MIIGVGVDIIEIDRIQKANDRWGEDFLKHIFNKEEIEYAQKKKFPTQHYAARFAAKEAIYKAQFPIYRQKLGFQEVVLGWRLDALGIYSAVNRGGQYGRYLARCKVVEGWISCVATPYKT